MFRRALSLLQMATRPISVLAAVAILFVQYAVMPLVAMWLRVSCPYMSDVVACALVAKVISYFLGRTAEKMSGTANVQ
jgi:hypothetical protein